MSPTQKSVRYQRIHADMYAHIEQAFNGHIGSCFEEVAKYITELTIRVEDLELELTESAIWRRLRG